MASHFQNACTVMLTESGWPQAKFAAKASISESMVSKIVAQGETPSRDVLARIFGYLLGEREEPDDLPREKRRAFAAKLTQALWGDLVHDLRLPADVVAEASPTGSGGGETRERGECTWGEAFLGKMFGCLPDPILLALDTLGTGARDNRELEMTLFSAAELANEFKRVATTPDGKKRTQTGPIYPRGYFGNKLTRMSSEPSGIVLGSAGAFLVDFFDRDKEPPDPND